MFKVKNKNTRTTPLALFWCLYCYLSTCFTPFSSVSIVNFEHEIAGWVLRSNSLNIQCLVSTKRCIQLQVYLSMFHRVKNILRHLLLFSVIESGNTFLDSHCKKMVLAIYYISPCIRSLPHVDMQSHHNYLVVSLTNYIQVYFCVIYFAYTNILFRAIIKNKKKKKK